MYKILKKHFRFYIIVLLLNCIVTIFIFYIIATVNCIVIFIFYIIVWLALYCKIIASLKAYCNKKKN